MDRNQTNVKVLQVIDSGGLYGAERVLLTLMDALRPRGVDCELASIGLPGEPEKPLETEAASMGLPTRRISMKVGVDRSAARHLIDVAATDHFDLLHTHGYKANILVGGVPRSRRSLPVVATLHGWTAGRTLGKMRLYETAERFALRRADRVVAVSQKMVDVWSLARRYRGRLEVIPNGIAVPESDDESGKLPPEVERFVQAGPTIAAVGRLSREKGFDVLLDALARVRSNGVPARLVIAGEGDERSALEQQARHLGLTDSIMLPGYIQSMGQRLNQFAFLCMPSRTEGLPIVMLEALLSGIPVVATSVGEVPAVLEHCQGGRAVPPDDAESLAAAISEALLRPADDPSRARATAAARERYSAGSMAAAYLKAYGEVAGTA